MTTHETKTHWLLSLHISQGFVVAVLYCFMNGEVRTTPSEPILTVLNVCSMSGIYGVYFSRCSTSFRGGGGGGGWPSTSPVGPGSSTAPSATAGLLRHRSPCCPGRRAARWKPWRCDSSCDRLIFSPSSSIHSAVDAALPIILLIWWHKDEKCTV